jgi:hypothetical protein
MDLAVALVGAPDDGSVEPLVRRFTDALRRVTRGRPVSVSVDWGAASLAESPSPEQGLEHALRGAAGETTESRGEPVPAGSEGP